MEVGLLDMSGVDPGPDLTGLEESDESTQMLDL